ncbi:Hvo_1808 family surface protein [Halobaculum lipolyticum]|uniref:Hvo_1808 family surface protein n=1 Tax=Halobaculum lipolyticum TaxID=3032001 RepID=A0ABD5WHT1_9EURY|nr:Hvo_1808 family surface protein [Halobaculum sp. DT31]
MRAVSVSAVAVAVLLVLSGCSAPSAAPAANDDWAYPDDPPTDRLGWEDGVWYNESIAVNQSDGLDAAEREAFVARTMARVERVRGLEFRETVPVEVISRAEYRDRAVFGAERSPEYEAWHEQVWEAALIVGEDRAVADEFDALYGGSVQGYYTPSGDRIVVVSDAENPTIDRGTLAHELVHALQDQHFGFTGSRTRDGGLAHNGLTEGDARYVETLYLERCAAGADPNATDGPNATADGADGDDGDDGWDCVPRPPRSGGTAGAPVNEGLFAYVYQPYADGPAFVHRLYERGGWDAVDAAYDRRPRSTEQTIHPERYPDEPVESVRVRDRSADDWTRFDLDRPATERLGETGLFAMFWYNDYVDGYRSSDLPYSPYNYSAAPSDGWAGDRLVPYRSDEGADARYGYVWAIEFDDAGEAEEFARSYRGMLRLRVGAETVDPRAAVYRVADGPFADAFRVERDGRRVTITNAPTVGTLDAVRDPPG